MVTEMDRRLSRRRQVNLEEIKGKVFINCAIVEKLLQRFQQKVDKVVAFS